MNEESGQEKGESDKKVVHVYPLVKVNPIKKNHHYIY